MIITQKSIPRRMVLRGLGASLALPLLDGMVPAFAAMRTTAANPPRRLGVVYVPNGMMMDHWTPATEGIGFNFPTILQPLERFRDQVEVLSGMHGVDAEGPHARASPRFLTGVASQRDDGSNLKAGISMDQILANTLGQETPLPSLELGLEGTDTVNGVGTCDVGFSCAYQNRLAWSGPSTPLPVETNPRVVFDRLFGSVDSTDPAVRKARLRRQGSIIDSVLDKVDRLQGALGQRDRAERTLHRVCKVERGVRHRARKIEREAIAPLDQHRRVGDGGFTLVGQLERLRARRRDQHPRAARIGFCRSLDRQQYGAVIDPDRPAMAQRIDRLRQRAGAAACALRAQSSNSVVSGTWSEGRSQLRASSRIVCRVACFARSGLAHMWSSRRPLSLVCQLGLR